MTIRHEPECTSRDDSTVYLTTGSRGDAMRRCRDCGRFELGAEPRPARTHTPLDPPRRALPTPWRARAAGSLGVRPALAGLP